MAKMFIIFIVAVAYFLSPTTSFNPASTEGTDKLAARGLKNLIEYKAKQHWPMAKCNITNSYARQEWSTLNNREKKAYISAVLCFMSKPSISGSLAPGARSRYDDFVAAHINQTGMIHGTVSVENS
jgi:tyrosinase